MSGLSGKTTFTLAEAAKLLSCHRETLRRAIRSGELRAAKLGRGYRISRFDLESFWTASGGGDLFGKEPADATDLENAEPPRRSRGGKNRQMQLSLPVMAVTQQTAGSEPRLAEPAPTKPDAAARNKKTPPQ